MCNKGRQHRSSSREAVDTQRGVDSLVVVDASLAILKEELKEHGTEFKPPNQTHKQEM
jgi:hypothetical protein